jgi:hypothetical protein
MEFTILQCWSCQQTFYTASERSTHHLEAHERLTLRDGTVLGPLQECSVVAQGPYAMNGVSASTWPQRSSREPLRRTDLSLSPP